MEPKFTTPEANYAIQFVNSTNRHIFLTGKAGTGKTTLLHHLKTYTHKNAMIAAPTGIAAINAKGVTLHSMFHLPFGTFIPVNSGFAVTNSNTAIATPNTLIKGLQMNNQKRNLLRAMELLIIDEVSMLRADLLDAIDTVLRYVRRRNNQPFGGVQILFIGDLMQLPPVIKEEEKPILAPYYPNMYFFNARALQHNPPVYIELEKIYRQSDEQFIGLLNRFRTNTITNDDIAAINKCYRPGFSQQDNDGYIHLTTHNHKADAINEERLEKLGGKAYRYMAEISGDFNDNSFPVEETLVLKEEAQVMFIKNDPSGEGAFYNGKLGWVSHLSSDSIEVSFDDNTPPVIVERYIWENKRYNLNPDTGEIEEKNVGTFSHYPLKLAWAITIHKSQGLTFTKAIIDVSQAFAPGQMYVALSRLTSLEGLVLSRPIRESGPDIELEVVNFARNKKTQQQLTAELVEARLHYLKVYAIESFNFDNLLHHLQAHIDTYNKDSVKSAKQKYKDWAVKLKDETLPMAEVATKFMNQLKYLAQQPDVQAPGVIFERMMAAQAYFTPLFEAKSKSVTDHRLSVYRLPGMKAYANELKALESVFSVGLQQINKAILLIKAVMENKEISKQNLKVHSAEKTIVPESTTESTKKKKSKKETTSEREEVDEKEGKKNTKQVSYELFLSGMSLEAIARHRSFSTTTIEGHLEHYVERGQLMVEKIIDPDKVQQIEMAFREMETYDLTSVKATLGEDFSYGEIRLVRAKLMAEKSGLHD